jgi:hypothetical protein
MTNWKSELQQGFAPPTPTRKRAFLRQFSASNMSFTDVLYSQIGYIQKWVWILSAVIYTAAILLMYTRSPYLLQMLSACTPLLALTIVAESSRSMCCGMAELELSTRFSLKTVVLARLIPLGCVHPMLILLLAMGLGKSLHSPLAAIVYTSAPFLLTAFWGLTITRKYRSHEALYACVGIAFAVSLLTLLSHKMCSVLYEARHLIWWILAVTALTIGTVKLFRTILFETEELAWS